MRVLSHFARGKGRIIAPHFSAHPDMTRWAGRNAHIPSTPPRQWSLRPSQAFVQCCRAALASSLLLSRGKGYISHCSPVQTATFTARLPSCGDAAEGSDDAGGGRGEAADAITQPLKSSAERSVYVPVADFRGHAEPSTVCHNCCANSFRKKTIPSRAERGLESAFQWRS